jgi:hypothetical protein
MSTQATLPKKYHELQSYRNSLLSISSSSPTLIHNFIQNLITSASGIAHKEQCQPKQTVMVKPLMEDLALLITGVTLSFLSACYTQYSPYALAGIVSGYAIATRGICSLIMVCNHHLTHSMGTGNKSVDDALGNIISIITITSPFPIYKAGHLNHHREAPTLKDFDAQQILDWGFEPGKPVEEYWKIFWRLVLSPIEHMKTAMARICGQFKQASNGMKPSSSYQIAFLSYWCICLGLAFYTGYLPAFLVAIIPPIIIGLQIGVIIEWVPRHHWFANTGYETVNKALFLYSANQPHLVQKLLTDLLVRGIFLSRDLHLHAYHHHMVTRKWINTTHEVQMLEEKAIASGKPGQFEYAMGYENALEILFEHLSSLPKDAIGQIA